MTCLWVWANGASELSGHYTIKVVKKTRITVSWNSSDILKSISYDDVYVENKYIGRRNIDPTKRYRGDNISLMLPLFDYDITILFVMT